MAVNKITCKTYRSYIACNDSISDTYSYALRRQYLITWCVYTLGDVDKKGSWSIEALHLWYSMHVRERTTILK